MLSFTHNNYVIGKQNDYGITYSSIKWANTTVYTIS